VSALTVWRLCPEHRAGRAVSGDGAFRRGGRWNPPGVRVVYFAESRSLAALEILANVRDAGLLFARPWVILPAEIPDGLIERPARVPDNWRAQPYAGETQMFGAEWVGAARSTALRVPSTVVLGEFNYLLNTAHPDFRRVRIGKPEPFSFDPRLG
jgi:RES domain-containing protein